MAEFTSTNSSSKPVLLLRGSRWGPENDDTFECFGVKIVVRQRPSYVLLDDHEHEAKTGLKIWDSSIALAKYLENEEVFPAGHWTNKRIIEVGSGCGLVGLCAAAGGASPVVLTDLPSLLPLLRENVEASNLRGRYLDIRPLAWGQTNDLASLLATDIGREGFDYVLCSDVVWLEHLVAPLVYTLKALCTAGRHNTTIIMAHEQRSLKVEARFFEAIEAEGFKVEKVPFTRHHPVYRAQGIDIYHLTLGDVHSMPVQCR